MSTVPEEEFPQISSRWRNDGRYFEFTSAQAGAFSRHYARWRRSALGEQPLGLGPIEI